MKTFVMVIFGAAAFFITVYLAILATYNLKESELSRMRIASCEIYSMFDSISSEMAGEINLVSDEVVIGAITSADLDCSRVVKFTERDVPVDPWGDEYQILIKEKEDVEISSLRGDEKKSLKHYMNLMRENSRLETIKRENEKNKEEIKRE